MLTSHSKKKGKIPPLKITEALKIFYITKKQNGMMMNFPPPNKHPTSSSLTLVMFDKKNKQREKITEKKKLFSTIQIFEFLREIRVNIFLGGI